jgi:hypothetical protein
MNLLLRRLPVLTILAGIASTLLLCCDSPLRAEDTAVATAREPDFGTSVRPFLKQYCVDCHTGDDAEAGIKLDQIQGNLTTDSTARVWESVLQALQFDDMPPPDEKRPDPLAKANVILWIEWQMAETGRAENYRDKLLKPEYGNYVSHELLFSGSVKTLPFSPSRLWRFSPQIFKRKGIREAQSPFSFVTSERGVRDYSFTSGVDQSTIEMILINTDQLLDLWTRDGKFKLFADDQPVPSDEQLGNVIRDEFRRAIGRLPSDEEQQKYLAFLKRNMSDGGRLEGLKTTIKAMYLCSESIFRMELGLGPKDEHGRRHLSPDELTYAITYALTDSLPEQNRFIRDASRQKKLKSKADVATVVKAILDEGMTPEKTPRIMRFLEEFFGYNQADKVFKDMARVREADIKQWNTKRLMYEAEQLVQYFINRDQNVISELLTSNRFYVAHPGDNDIARQYLEEVLQKDYVERKVNKRIKDFKRAKRDPERKQEKEELERIRRQGTTRAKVVREALEDKFTPFPGWPYERVDGTFVRGQSDLIYIGVYNLPPTHREQRQKWSWEKEQPFELPKDQRAGILTHPAWLAAHSVNDGNDPVRRGRWIQEKLLAGVIQDVPPDVDANVPNDPHKTLRERMEPLRATRCWRCHRKMNPLGEPFEIFDDWGRHRTQVYFDADGKIVHKRGEQFDRQVAEGKLTSRKIDATGEIRGSGDQEVDGQVEDAIEMLHRLGNSTRARQAFIRHLFRYFMGRNEMLSDSQTLIEAEKSYLDNGGSFKALVVSLLSSDSFLYRR